MNLVVQTGNLTADPEMRYVGEGKAVTSFRIAVNEGSGERRKTVFLNCEAWDRLAETVAEHKRKGHKVLVLGSLEDDSWTDRNGQKRTGVKIRCRNVEFLDRPGQDAQPEPAAAPDDLSDLTF